MMDDAPDWSIINSPMPLCSSLQSIAHCPSTWSLASAHVTSLRNPATRLVPLASCEPQELDLGTDELAPAEVVGETEQRREPCIRLAAAALAQVREEVMMADVFQP